MGHLESLKAVAAFGLLPDDIEDRIDQLGSLCVVTLGPVVSGTALTKDEVVWSEDLSEGTGPHGIHGAWLEIH